MPYVVTRLSPRKKEIDLLDFLNDLVTLDMMLPPTKYQQTGTRTFYYDHINPEKLEQLNIPKQIAVLEMFYENYKHLDICNGNENYNYELQLDIIREYKSKGFAEEEANEACKNDLRERGYKFFALYDTFWVPKKSSQPGHKKWRRIDAPCDELKNCLKSLKIILERLMSDCYYHTTAFAYIDGRSAKDAVNKHANNKSNWFLKLDFSNFFGSTTLDFVMNMMSEVFPFSEIMKYENGKIALRNCLNLGFLNGGLPQGTPLSPILTNIMMIAIDHNLNKALLKEKVESPSGNQGNFIYTRYADDILISNRFKFDHNKIVSIVKSVLNHYNAPFNLNDDKTKYCSNAGSNWILGLMLNQKHEVTVGYKRKKYLKSTLTNYMLDRANGRSWLLEDVQHLQGEIAYCKSVEPETIDYILDNYSKKYGNIREAIKADIKRLA